MLAETKETGRREPWAKRGAAFFSKPRRANCANRHSGASGRRATGIKPQGRDMTCARGRSNAGSARGC
ncbi:hypothetical protein [Bradyrhizobium sp. STM 3562]|uniref:hypothetical protein n=1 Tax=Bradyrhizobium sp. STM 3562 TaxID=578924 RepID=UPI00388D475F